MFKVFVFAITLLATLTGNSALSQASEKAMTGSGKVVILNDNGTWAYADPNDVPVFSEPLETNKSIFHRTKSADFFVQSNINSAAFWINPQKWSFKKSEDSEPTEYEFDYKHGDVYGMVINEEIHIPVEKLIEIAFGFFTDVDPNAKVIKKEYRDVNGLKVIYMESSLIVSGISMVYACYYYSNEDGATQLVTYTGAANFEKYRKEIEEFLNGLVIEPT